MNSCIVIAPDSFKGSLPAALVAQALADGWRSVDADADLRLRPMADGGEGTVDAFAAAVPGAQRRKVTVTGPDGESTDAWWLLLPPDAGATRGTGVVELASTSGIELLGTRRLPWDAGTLGFGQAIAAALDHGVSRLVLGIGSSASTDGGTGLLVALGARFTDAAGQPIATGARGLVDLAAVDMSALRPLPTGGVTVLSDVTNTLCGDGGAAVVFGPQKGLDAAGVRVVDGALGRYATLLGVDDSIPGSGAAGGVGYALRVWGGQLVPGAAAVADLVGLRDALSGATLVITGEGSFDGQSAEGKAPTHVAQLAAAAGVPVALVAGRIEDDAAVAGFVASLSLCELAGSAEGAMESPVRWLKVAGRALAKSCAR